MMCDGLKEILQRLFFDKLSVTLERLSSGSDFTGEDNLQKEIGWFLMCASKVAGEKLRLLRRLAGALSGQFGRQN